MYHLFPNLTYGPLFTAILASTLIGLTSYYTVFKTGFFRQLVESPLVPPFISISSGILGLLLAFLASAVWHNASVAEEAIIRENIAIRRLYALPLSSAEIKLQTENKLKEYVSLVQSKEWGLLKNSRRVKEVDDLCQELMSLCWKFSYEDSLKGQPVTSSNTYFVKSEYLKWMEQLETSREKRLSLGRLSHMGYLNKWMIIYLLTFVAAVGIAAVHRAKNKTAIIALIIFCSAIAMAYSMISLYVHPYLGPGALEPSLSILANGH